MTVRKLDGKSFDNIQSRIDELKRLFPEAVKEGRFDPELLVGLLEENDETYGLNEERYDFTWKGKADALRLAQRRSDGTLRPCFEESRDWDTTQNLYIEGDNLEVMKLLQQGYLRSVKMIYIDPPYNTGNDFVYQDDFADPIAKYKEATGQGMRANPETAGRYHSNWLSMMYPRLKIAKTLLRDDGVIFISIDDNEVHNLRRLCDDVFGEENFVANVLWQKKYAVSNDDPGIAPMHDHILVYRRSAAFQRLLLPRTDKQLVRYKNIDNDPRGVWSSDNYVSNKSRWERPTLWYPITHPKSGEDVWPDENAVWRYAKEKHEQLQAENRLYWGPDQSYEKPRIKRFLNEVQDGVVPSTWWEFEEVGHNDEAVKETGELLGKKIFSTPKPVRLLKRILEISAPKDAIVMDFFSGSAAMAHAAMQLNAEDEGNRRFILIQLPEPTDEKSEAYQAGFKAITDIGKERLRKASERIITEWQSKQTANAGKLPFEEAAPTQLDAGFRVFKLDSSNLQKWDGSFLSSENTDLFLNRAEHSLDNMKQDRRDIDMIYEVFLKYGVPLTEKLSTLKIQGKTFYIVGDTGYLMICLDKGITVEIVEETVKAHTPGAIIFADECFADDDELTNAGLALDKAQIEFRWI